MAEKHVFLSHSSADKVLATAIAEKLRGVGVWVDFWDLDTGDLLPNRIAEAIYGSKWFVLIASSHAMDSRWIKYEINSAIIRWIEDRDYKIVVAKIDNCTIPKELSPFLYINTPKKPYACVEQILQTVTSDKVATRLITSRRSNIVDRFEEIGSV